jgi:hypothetical protein
MRCKLVEKILNFFHEYGVNKKTFKKTLGKHLPIWNYPNDDFKSLK